MEQPAADRVEGELGRELGRERSDVDGQVLERRGLGVRPRSSTTAGASAKIASAGEKSTRPEPIPWRLTMWSVAAAFATATSSGTNGVGRSSSIGTNSSIVGTE